MEQEQLAEDLKNIIGDRVTTSEYERWFYSSDIIHIPGGIRALFNTMPAAVVKPETTAQVAAVIRYCKEHGLPVVPRGGGSSGLFGAVPKKGGVVFDLRDLRQVTAIDAGQQTVTAGAGITWWQLEGRLNPEGLSLRSYPSSARSATLGGWVMTGGMGIGSLKYGPVFDSVLAAEIVHPDGSIRGYEQGAELKRFFETEGILGILTRLTLKVRQSPPFISHHLIYFNDIENLFQALASLVADKPRPYNVEFLDHGYLGLLKASGYDVQEFGPRSGTLLVTYDGDRESVEDGKKLVAGLAGRYHGEEREGAEREWQHRFNLLRVRRAVPNIIPSSVYLPLGRIGQFYAGLEKLAKRSIGLVGYVVSDSQCNLMPMIATDQHSALEYTFAMHTPGELTDMALPLGGKPGGGTAVWNAPYRDKILGAPRIAEIKRLKAEIDPGNIMNPGMWLKPPVLFQPRVYKVAMGLASAVDKILPGRIGPTPAEHFKNEISACVQCGYCMNVCPTRQMWLSSTPRGRILMTKELLFSPSQWPKKMAQEYVNSVFQCSVCGRCGVDCSVDIDARPMWQGVRSQLIKNGLSIGPLKDLVKIIDETHNINGKPNDQRANWASRVKLPYDLKTKKKAEVIYYIGCVTSFFPMAQPAARAFAQILDAAGVDFAILGGEEWCCGFPLMAAGYEEAAARCARHNIERLSDMGAKTLVMTCPGCYRVWKEEYREVVDQKHPFDVFHATEFIARLIQDNRLNIRGLEKNVTYHDPCDLARNSGIYEEPRYIMGKIPGLNLVELKENRKYCNCCGSGGDLLASNQGLSLDIAGRKVQEILDTGVETAVTACPSCVRAIHMAKTAQKAKLDILDITEVVWKAMNL